MRWGLLLVLMLAGCAENDGFAEALAAMDPVYVDPAMFREPEPVQAYCYPTGYGFTCTGY